MPFTATKLGAIQASVIVGMGGPQGSQVLDAGAFWLSRRVTGGNEADFQCLRLDDHARDMAFDQLAVRGSRRRLPLKVPANPFAHEGLNLGGRYAGDAACLGLRRSLLAIFQFPFRRCGDWFELTETGSFRRKIDGHRRRF